MAIVNDKDGFTQLGRLNILDEFLIKGNPVFGIDSSIIPLADGQVFKYDEATDSLIYAGATVDDGTGEWTFDQSINVPAGSLNIGTNVTISDYGESQGIKNNAFDIQSMVTGSVVEDPTGILDIEVPFSPPLESFFVATVDTDTSELFTDDNPQEQLFTPVIFTSSVPTDEFLVILNELDMATVPPSGLVNNKLWIGTDDTGTLIFDHNFEVAVGLVDFRPPNPQTFRSGVTYFSRSVPVGGGSFSQKGEQVSPSVFVPKSDIQGHAVQRRTNSHEGNVKSHLGSYQYAELNSSYTDVSAQTTGVVANYLPTATTDTVTAGEFSSGVASTSNPAVVTDTATVFSQDDIIQVTESKRNDGFYEVESHAGTLLTIRGVGTVGTVEDFSNNDFFPEVDSGVITKVNVSVMRSGTDGVWETGVGAKTPIVYTDIGGGGDMLASVYDPTNIAADAFARGNHTGTQLASTISDFDTEVSNNSSVTANTAKVTNATHTGEVTGSGALTVDSTAISNKTLEAAASGMEVLVNDSGTLKKVDAADLLSVDISCKVTKTSNQSIPNATLTAITWNQESYDTDGMHDTVTNNTRVTFNTAGKYSVLAQAEWEAAGGVFRFLEIMKNGSGGIARVRYGAEGSSENIVPYVGEFQVGDYIELCVYQDAGGNIDFESGTGVENTYLEAHKIN